jgi:hypothetical protein
MSDAYYQERATRRTRTLLIAIGLVALVACVVGGVASLFYDACTRSFDRSPQAVVSAYAEAVERADQAVAQECWEHETYYDLEAGCSQVCLSRALGAQYDVIDMALGPVHATPGGRANLEVTVSVVCTEGGQEHTAEVLLDSVGGNVPWKHWAIIHSTVGGTVAEAWCK